MNRASITLRPPTLRELLCEHDVLEEQRRDAAQERELLIARIERGDAGAKALLVRNTIRLRALKRLASTFARRVVRETSAV